MHNYDELLKITSDAISGCCFNGSPDELYEPARYTMTQGGKRIRPVMVLMSCEMFGGNILRALPAATGIEIFHNFTLVHDDIMDDAPLRRGKETVYRKWGSNTAILSGDTMFAKAYEQIFRLDIPDLRPVLEVFTKTAIEVCEGQQFDMNFEKQSEVSTGAYLEMIRLKTAVLIACCLKTGALVAGAPAEETEKMYRFGGKPRHGIPDP
jgi:geranylgeranyl diphosphate synthase, type II